MTNPTLTSHLNFLEYLLGTIVADTPYEQAARRMHWLATNLPQTFTLLNFTEGWSELEEGLG